MKFKGEAGYLQLVKKVLKSKILKPNRTGTPTLSLFGEQLLFDLRNGSLPLMTTKFLSFKQIAHELLWFMKGDTNQKSLDKVGVNIWKGNSTRDFLDNRNLNHYKEYESLGPIYGFQWRHFNARYVDATTDYKNQGIDQLAQVIEMIKNNPTSRRIIMTAWNPSCIDEMVLPPCHILVQFDVDIDKNELSSQMYQRSGDLMLGIPYNIVSYSLLTHILAKMCGLKTGKFIHCIGNVHIYANHIQNAKIQTTRLPYPSPTIAMSEELHSKKIDDITINDFIIHNYKYHPKLKFDLIV